MLSNAVALTTISDSVSHTVSDTDTDTDSKTEIDAILKLQFAEPLPTVLKRAQKASKTMPVTEALQTVGHRMTKEIRGMLEDHNASHAISLRASNKGTVVKAPNNLG